MLLLQVPSIPPTHPTPHPVSPNQPQIDAYTEEIESLKITVISQQKIISSLRVINRRLHSKNFRLKSKSLQTARNITTTTTPVHTGDLNDFLVRQQNTRICPRGNRYNSKEKMFALSLWHASPNCYRLLRSTFSLPSITTLRRSIRMIDMKPGFHPRILECIKDRASSFSDKELLVAVAFDEMSIKTSLIFDQRLDSVVGYEDIGDGVRSDKVASYATVFMVRGIFGTWKQPVGYFLTSGTMSAEISKQKLEQCLSQLGGAA